MNRKPLIRSDPEIPPGDERLVVFDKTAFLNRAMNDEKLIRMLVGTFLQDLPILMEKLASAVSARDGKQVGQLAHKMRGTAANMSAEELCSTVAAMETAVKISDFAVLDRLMPELRQQSGALKVELETAFG